ncbi:methyltransferase, FkbM family [Solimonas aquatica]|uniref:Methyltransferase, FkbM family n=1 Tax=Solimonas aquatica TaxID=489703 RepID=A0A1H9BWS6_9GAMM|nr:FkbM family methyltransferase [Solimonas aquatica]SEP92798.1 methyltransferase, FkbM family [Solimonas aquatica]
MSNKKKQKQQSVARSSSPVTAPAAVPAAASTPAKSSTADLGERFNALSASFDATAAQRKLEFIRILRSLRWYLSAGRQDAFFEAANQYIQAPDVDPWDFILRQLLTDADLHLSGRIFRIAGLKPLPALMESLFVRLDCFFESADDAPLIVDAGAGIGLSSYYFKRLKPQARIRAFEPNPALRALLERNIARNKLSDIRIEPEGEAADILDRAIDEPVDMLRIDLHGAEKILSRLSGKLGQIKHVFCKCNDVTAEFPSNSTRIIRILEAAGFEVRVGFSAGVDDRQTLRPIQLIGSPQSVSIYARRGE